MHSVKKPVVPGEPDGFIASIPTTSAALGGKKLLLTGLLALASFAGQAQQSGRILVEQWTGIAGPYVSDLTNTTTNPNYPARPAHRDYPNTLEVVSNTAANLGDNYGTRFRGYVQAPASGNYIFWVAGDDNTELWLSTDTNPANKVKIAYSSYTNLRQWDKYTTQQSGAKNLTGGQKYYLEVLHKQGTQGSHVSVGWQLPDGTLERPIGGDRLSAFQVATVVPVTAAEKAAVLNNLTTAHPRLLGGSALAFARIKQQVAVSGSAMAASFAALELAATRVLTKPVIPKPTTDEQAVDSSRAITTRVRLLAFVYRVSNASDKAKYLNRAWTELNNIISTSTTGTAWASWYPRDKQIIDVAELTTAAAIGYDWLHDGLTTTQRDALRNAIINKGLNEAEREYLPSNNIAWSRRPYNFNAVCNGGFSMGALAIADEDATATAEAKEVMGYVVTSLPIGVQDFAPDGGWDEGPGYWDYTTSRLANLFSTTEAALGSSFGIADSPGLAQTGVFVPYMNRPTTNPKGFTFNHADGGNELSAKSQLLWMANRYNQPLYATLRNKAVGNTANASSTLSDLDMLWYNAHYNATELSSLALDRYFRSSEIAMMRSAWDAAATCVGLKAGNNLDGHEQLDIGTFVLDAKGYKWAEELGNDRYGLSGYFTTTKPATGTYRYDYYRVRAEGQNTLLINPNAGIDQTQTLVAPITRFESNPDEVLAVADLKLAYAGKVTSALRGTRLYEGRSKVLIQDEIVATASSEIWWQMHTRTPSANIELRDAGKTILLKQDASSTFGTKWLWLHIVSGPSTAVFATRSATPLPTSPNPSGQNANGGVTKIYVKMTGVTTTTLAILAVPLNSLTDIPNIVQPTITPISQWGQAQAQAVANGTYQLIVEHSGKALDVNWGSQDDTAPIQQYTAGTGNNQRWQVTAIGNGYYKLVAAHSGKALTVQGFGTPSATADGTRVQQLAYTGAGTTAQHWLIEPVASSPGYYTVKAECSGKVLDVEGASSNDGALVLQYGYGGANSRNAHWRFAPVSGARGVLATTTQLAANAALTLYPNPAQNAVTVELTSAAAQAVKIRVTSALGQALDLQTISVPAGVSRHKVDTSRLANGLYLLTVQQGTTTSSQRLLIAR